MTVVAIGLYVPDHYLFVDRLPMPGESVEVRRYVQSHGGKAANQAVASALAGAPTFFVGAVGADLPGRQGLAAMSAYGVDTSRASVVDGAATGMSSIYLAPDGTQMIGTFAGAGARIDRGSVEAALKDLQPDIALLQGEVTAELALELVGARIAPTVILDPSPADAFIGLSLEKCDIITPNSHEADLLVGSRQASASAVADATGVDVVIVTRGADGAEVFDRGTTTVLPGIDVHPCDTSGAGDAFNGALAAALDAGGCLLDAATAGIRASAWSVTREFCMPSYATAEELASWRTGSTASASKVAT
ncbi:PfkB family carbohydrate kinase [Ruicaihuangia caeni]|uniref:PfkB family carbohydrate kinase n=1 Tax=Ruicaihuangia caeni TaxID=3042517 RepID=UPI00338EF2CC